MDTKTPHNMLVNCTAYGGGASRPIKLEEIHDVLKETGTFVWVGLHEPDEPLLEQLAEIFHLHELSIEDAHCAHQRTKIEVYGDSLFIVVHTAQFTEHRIAFGETHMFLGKNYLVTIRHGASLSYAPARRMCESTPELLSYGPSYALYAVLDFVVDNYFPIMENFQKRLNDLEHQVLQGEFQQRTIVRLYELT